MFRTTIALLAALLLAGCEQNSPYPVSVAEATAQPPAQEAVSLKVLDYQGIIDLVASHRGQVVVMDAWSTACPPCVAEFPNFVQFSRKYVPDVACISLSFDYEGFGSLAEIEQRVLDFLRQQQATCDNVLSSDESDALYQHFELAAVPAVFVYDRAGQLVKRFDNETGEEFTYEDVERFVRALLENGSAN